MANYGNFGVFDYGNVLAKAEGIKGARINNALAQRQLDPNSTSNQLQAEQLTTAKNRNQSAFNSQQLENTKTLYMAATEISQNPASAQHWIPRLQEQGIMRGGFDLTSMSPEQIQAEATQIAQSTGAALRGMQMTSGQPYNPVGKYNPGDYTPESFADFKQGGYTDPNALQRYEPYKVVNVNGVPTLVSTNDQAGTDTTQPLSSIESESGAEQTLAGATEQGKKNVQLNMNPQITQAETFAQDDAGTVVKTQNQIGVMLTQNRKLTKVIQLAKRGADTGPIMKWLPSLTAQSQSLDQLQKTMGLDIIGSVTFGALSKGELDLSMVTAIPTNMDEPDLIAWAEQKQIANQKLMEYLMKQIQFLRSGGTKAEWQQKVIQAGGIEESQQDLSTMSTEELEAMKRELQ